MNAETDLFLGDEVRVKAAFTKLRGYLPSPEDLAAFTAAARKGEIDLDAIGATLTDVEKAPLTKEAARFFWAFRSEPDGAPLRPPSAWRSLIERRLGSLRDAEIAYFRGEYGRLVATYGCGGVERSGEPPDPGAAVQAYWKRRGT